MQTYYIIELDVKSLSQAENSQNRQTEDLYHRYPYIRQGFGQTRGSRQNRLLGFAVVLFSLF